MRDHPGWGPRCAVCDHHKVSHRVNGLTCIRATRGMLCTCTAFAEPVAAVVSGDREEGQA